MRVGENRENTFKTAASGQNHRQNGMTVSKDTNNTPPLMT
jgi:hypothetical protein